MAQIFQHTVINAFAIPINMDMAYMNGLMLPGKRIIATPQKIQRTPPAV